MACLLLAGAAQAASLNIGNESISYTVPQGYIAGDKEPYLESRKFLTKILPKDMQLLALYVEEESHKKFTDLKEQRLDRYFIICTLRPWADKTLSVQDFAELKKSVAQVQDQVKTTFKQQINRALGEAGEGNISVGDIDALGVFDDTDTAVSFMMVVDQVNRAAGRREVDKQAVVSSYLLAQGKLIIVNQYQLLDPAKNMAEQLSAAKAQAQKILEELAVKQDVPWTSYLDSFLGKVVLAALIGAVIGGLIGWLSKRNKKKKEAGA